MPTAYRCPRCQTPATAGVCPSCGHSASESDATWFLGDDPAPVNAAAAPAEPKAVEPSPRKPRTRRKAATAEKPAKAARPRKKTARTPRKPAAAGATPPPSPPPIPSGPHGELSETNVRLGSPARSLAEPEHPADWTPAAVDQPDEAIARFEGRYELLGEIGAGGMGVVYKAYDRELDEVIALKSLPEAVRADPGRIARFKNEIKLARRLSHPNIARVHDLVELHGRLCLSMAFIAGRWLDAIVRTEGALEPARVVRHLEALVPALTLAHESGVVHRDIKPANIIVDAQDAPHIVDFGIAASGSDTGRSRVGTPPYMAPECWLAGQPGIVVDSRCDLYALGVTLYQMLCGHVPFHSRDMAVLIEMHCRRPPLRPKAIKADIPDALEAVVMRLLEKEPTNRFQKAAEILEALDPQRGRAMLRTRPPGSVPPILKPEGYRGKVLLAEGDGGVAKALGDRIRGERFLVIHAEDGAQALEKAFREQPDLILLDAELEQVDLLSVLRWLKQDERTRWVPVVVLGDHDDPEYGAAVRDVGADHLMVKPIPPATLELLLGRYFG